MPSYKVGRYGPPPVECRHHRRGIGAPVLGILGGSALAAYVFRHHSKLPVTAAPPASAPKVKIVTRTITHVVHVAPALSGTDIVLIIVALVVMVLGVASIILNCRRR